MLNLGVDQGERREFFEEMATDWRGWPGSREWRSLKGDLELLAEYQPARETSRRYEG
jgi:hypothetical protein